MKKYLSFICFLIVSFTLCITPAFGKAPESYFDNAKIIPWAVEPKYEDIEPYKTTVLVKQNGLWGMINTKEEWIIKPKYVDVILNHTQMTTPEKLIGVKYNDLWGFIDEQGKVVIEPQYESVQNFNEGLAPAKKAEKWGFIDTKGRWIIKPQYEYTTPFKEGFARIGEPEITETGEVGGDYDGYTSWGITGFIDKTGEHVISVEGKYGPPRYVGDFNNGIAKVISAVDSFDRGAGYIDTTGKKIIQGYHDVGNFSDGLAWVVGFNLTEEEASNRLEKYGYEDEKLKNMHTLGYIDAAGNEVISNIQANEVFEFRYGLGVIKKYYNNGESPDYAVIDKTGEILMKFNKQHIWAIGENLLATRDNYSDGTFKLGIKDINGKVIISPVTSIGLTDLEANILLFEYDNHTYILNDKAEVIGKVEGDNCDFNEYSPYIRITKDGLWGLVVNPLFEKEDSNIK